MSKTREQRRREKYDDERKVMLAVLAFIIVAVAFVVSGVNALAMAAY